MHNCNDTERCAVCDQSMNALDIDAHCPTGFCLPMYEGEINWSSDFYAFVCRKCHDMACAAYEAALKDVEDPNTQPFEGRS